MATYTNTHTQYDCALDGTPFFYGPTAEFPYVRQTSEYRRQQIDSTNEPGEQSLTSWWYRSQSSFHMGAGLQYFDPIKGDEVAQYQFWDSAGVDVFSDRGEVSLLRECTKVYTQTNWGDLCSYAYTGESGVLFESGASNDELRYYTTAAATGTITWGGSTNIWDIDASGKYYWVAANAGIYRGPLSRGSSGVLVYDYPGAYDRGYVRSIRGVVYASGDGDLFELPQEPAGTLPLDLPVDYDNTGSVGPAGSRLLMSHKDVDWVWNAIEPGPDSVFFSGYSGTGSSISGNRSAIYASTIEIDNVSALPQTTQPVQVAELPYGEYVLSMTSYLGTFMVVTTTKGVRVCAIGEGGQLQMGPLSIEIDNYSYGACVWDKYVFVGGATVDSYDGLYVIDLTRPVGELKFAYAKSLASTHASASTGYVARVAMLGNSGRVAFYVDNSGLWVEGASTLVASGWLQTGVIRFDTWQEKLFQGLRSAYDERAIGTVQPYWISQADSATSLGSAASSFGVPYRDTAGSDGVAKIGLSYKWVLTRDGTYTQYGPKFRGYQAKALPVKVVQREFRLPLLCYRRERMRNGRTVERSVLDRVQALEALERAGTVFSFQDFGTGETKDVVIESLQFATTRPVQSRAEGADPGGMIMVTLRTAD